MCVYIYIYIYIYTHIYIQTYIYIYTLYKYIYNRQMQYQQLKSQEHFQTSGKGEFKIFPFFELHPQNKYLREQHEKYVRVKFKLALH